MVQENETKNNMLTSETKNYRYPLDDKSSVLDRVNKLLDDPQFSGVNITIGQEWASGADKPTAYYSVSVHLKANATNK